MVVEENWRTFQKYEDWKVIRKLTEVWAKTSCFEIPKNTYPFDCSSLYWIEKVREGKDFSCRRKGE